MSLLLSQILRKGPYFVSKFETFHILEQRTCMETNSNLQERLFELLKEKKAAGQIVTELIEKLSISRASVYKRMKGEIHLTMKEMEVIMQHFDIDILRLIRRNSNEVIMQLPAEPEGDPIIHFLKPIKDQLEYLVKNEASKVTFLAVSFPVFYSFLYPELALFKFYVYRNSVWKPSHAKISPLGISQMSRNQEYINLFAAIRNAYGKIDSTEVWSSDFYTSTINELKFYLECNLFSEPNEALVILDKLLKSIENISSMVQAGNKSTMTRSPEKEEGGRFQLFYNDSGHFGSTILAHSGSMKNVYLTYDQPNYLFSQDPLLFEDTEKWVTKVIKKSTPITDKSPFEQIKFFNTIRDKIKEEIQNVEKMIK